MQAGTDECDATPARVSTGSARKRPLGDYELRAGEMSDREFMQRRIGRIRGYCVLVIVIGSSKADPEQETPLEHCVQRLSYSFGFPSTELQSLPTNSRTEASPMFTASCIASAAPVCDLSTHQMMHRPQCKRAGTLCIMDRFHTM